MRQPAVAKDWLTEAGAGVADILPALLACVPIGMLYGAIAATKGLSVAEIGLSSALVFAGGAQFAALELWRTPAPVALLVFSTFLINARFVLMATSLAPKTGTFSKLQRTLGFAFLTDENWAMSERRAAATIFTPAYFLTMVAVFWANWVAVSILGAIVGASIGDPKKLGADFALTALFIGLVAGFCRGRPTAFTIAVSAAVSGGLYLLVGPPWHVAGGAIAGLATAYFFATPAKPSGAR